MCLLHVSLSAAKNNHLVVKALRNLGMFNRGIQIDWAHIMRPKNKLSRCSASCTSWGCSRDLDVPRPNTGCQLRSMMGSFFLPQVEIRQYGLQRRFLTIWQENFRQNIKRNQHTPALVSAQLDRYAKLPLLSWDGANHFKVRVLLAEPLPIFLQLQFRCFPGIPGHDKIQTPKVTQHFHQV